MFPSGGTLDPLKWGQNEDVKGEVEDFKSATIEFYGSNIVYYDSFDVLKAIWANSLHRNALWLFKKWKTKNKKKMLRIKGLPV